MNAEKMPAKRSTSVPPLKRNAITPKSTTKSGAVDEEVFINSFEDVPRVQISSGKDLESELTKIKEICSDASIDWEKRTNSLRRLRSLLIAGATEYEEFYASLKPLELPFQTSVKDLRSQVAREACITIAYLSQRIGIRCDRFAEALLPALSNLIQNGAKIMSSSAVVAIRFIIQHTHSSRLIPVITYNISSKSKEIRKASCEFLDQLLYTWPTHALDKHVAVLSEAIKKGISDADPEARALSRKAFWSFSDKFKSEADFLLNSLDSAKQKILQDQQHISNGSGTHSLNRRTTKPQSTINRNLFSNGSNERIERIENIPSSNYLMSKKTVRTAIPHLNAIPTRNNLASYRPPVSLLKTTSAIDSGAQSRAKARAVTTVTTVPKARKSTLTTNGLNLSSLSDFNLILNELRSDSSDDVESQKENLNALIELIREGSSDEWNTNFKTVFNCLFNKISNAKSGAIRAHSLRVMCELLMKRTKYFREYIEFTILRVLEASKDTEKEVVRNSEVTAATAATVLPPKQCVTILTSLIEKDDKSMNVAAFKMLSKLIEVQPKSSAIELLPEIMPTLLQAYDNPEIGIRKATVFCMVSIYGVVGDDLIPYLLTLNSSKMKLLKLYIEKAKSQICNSQNMTANY